MFEFPIVYAKMVSCVPNMWDSADGGGGWERDLL